MAILLDANFAGGGVENVRIWGDTVYFSAPIDGSLTCRSLWYYFRVRRAAGRTLVFVLEDMEHTLDPWYGAGYSAVLPVVREGEDGIWERILPEAASFSKQPLSYTFQLTPQTDETYIAFCYPYQYEDLLRFAERYPSLKIQYLGKTAEGRDFPVLFAEGAGRKLIIASARQHSGETPGSFVLDGFIDAFLSESECGSALRKEASLLVLPMVNLDGVEAGRYGKDSPPVDYNRAWERESLRPEIRAFYSHLDRLAKEFTPWLYFDFHAPQPGGFCYVVPPREGELTQEQWQRVNALIDAFETRTQNRARCCRKDLDPAFCDWSGDNYMVMSKRAMSEAYDMEGVSLESSYHLDSGGQYLTPDDWRFMGREFLYSVCMVWLWGQRPKQTDSTEILLAGWEVVSIPKDVQISAEKNIVKVCTTGGSPYFLIGDKRVIKGGETGFYSVSCNGKAQLYIHVYYNRNGKTAKRSRPFIVSAAEETVSVEYSILQNGLGCDSFRAAFELKSLDGDLEIGHR